MTKFRWPFTNSAKIAWPFAGSPLGHDVAYAQMSFYQFLDEGHTQSHARACHLLPHAYHSSHIFAITAADMNYSL